MTTLRFGLPALFAGAILTTAMADDIRWISEVDGLYHHAPNWSPSAVPGSADRAIFDLGGVLKVYLFTDPVNDALFVRRGTVTFDLGGRTYAPGHVTIGGGANFGSVIIEDGGMFAPEFTWLGDAGRPGFLSITDGSAFESELVILGDLTSTGVMNVTGASTAVVGGMQVYDDGALGVNDGATLEVSGLIDLGALAQAGDGVLEVITGGHVAADTIYVGLSAGSTNRMRVDGADSTVSAATLLEIGRRGGGSSTVSGDATVTAGELLLGATSGDAGHLTIDAATVDTGEATILRTGRLTLLNQADLKSDTEVLNGGVIEGDGQIRAPLRNKGTMKPGGDGAWGALRVPQDYFVQETGGGVLEIEIDGPNNRDTDRVRVRGDVVLGGTLDVRVLGGYEPTFGRRHNVLLVTLESGTLTGEFDTVLPPDTWNALYESDGVYLTPIDGACPDLDGSGDIGFGDILEVLGSWGPCPGCPGDVNGDEIVDFEDLLLLLSIWGPCDA